MSETRLSTPFNKILATPLFIPLFHPYSLGCTSYSELVMQKKSQPHFASQTACDRVHRIMLYTYTIVLYTFLSSILLSSSLFISFLPSGIPCFIKHYQPSSLSLLPHDSPSLPILLMLLDIGKVIKKKQYTVQSHLSTVYHDRLK